MYLCLTARGAGAFRKAGLTGFIQLLKTSVGSKGYRSSAFAGLYLAMVAAAAEGKATCGRTGCR
jgi:hypothetical protein